MECISIHAPARGATFTISYDENEYNAISIHAPARGATTSSLYSSSSSIYFNPRTREGCDSLGHKLTERAIEISIHAPARGATATYNETMIPTERFQSTHPRGVRRAFSCASQSPSSDFNPRTREGCDLILFSANSCLDYFNPRTREGCDGHSPGIHLNYRYFNPRTREGCDGLERGDTYTTMDFNPRTREGCDRHARLRKSQR